MEVAGKIIIIGIIGTVLSLLLKKDSPVFSLAIGLITGIIIFFIVSDMLSYALANIKALFFRTDLNEELITSVFKISAVGLISEYFCGVIKDAGEEGIAKKIELGAKTVIFIMMLPVVVQVMEEILKM